MTRVSPGVRLQVRERAHERCEYCRKPERFSPAGYHTDHIIPVKRHLGSPGITNLAWACPVCNTNKSSDIATYDMTTKALTPLYNPRTQPWDDHFEIQDGVILGKTTIGQVTIRLLDMNEPREVQTRFYILKAGLW